MNAQPSLNFDGAPVVHVSPRQLETQRRETNYQRVLTRLRQGSATNHELAEIAGYRFGARLGEIRDNGGDFRGQHVTGGTWMYELVTEPTR